MDSFITRLGKLYEISSSTSRLTPMEGLRGLAVILVFFTHFQELFRTSKTLEISWAQVILKPLAVVGNSGVDLFFVLSGYLIYGALIKREISYPKFIKRRIQRIYPTFTAVFIIYLILSFSFPQESKLPYNLGEKIAFIAANFLLLPGMLEVRPIIVVAWTLSYEFFFYITLPLVILATGMRVWANRSRVLFFIFIWIVWAAFSTAVYEQRVRLIMFLPGILLYETTKMNFWRDRLSQKTEMVTIVFWFLSFIGLYYFYTQENVISFLPVSFSFFLLCLHCFEYRGILNRVFSWMPLRYLGNMSYSYYLIHVLTIKGLTKVLKPDESSSLSCLITLIITFLATLIVSTLLFIFVERPFSLDVSKNR